MNDYKLMEIDKQEMIVIQEKAIEILEYFDDFCNNNDLQYFVIGGACIGAVRDKKLLPWDDDIDVFMKRKDYEKLHSIWNSKGNTEKYTLCRSNEQENFHNTATLLKDNETTFINSHSVNLDINHGYMIDIIPIDILAPTFISRKIQMVNAMVYSLFNAQRLPDNQGGMVRFLSSIIVSLIRSPKLQYKLWSRSEKRMTRYEEQKNSIYTELVTGFKYMGNEYSLDAFADTIDMDISMKIPLKIPVGYDEYLTKAFGDYMTPPADLNQKPKHKIVFFDMKNSYEKYRGIYFLKEDKHEI